jgi:hypothetical protein
MSAATARRLVVWGLFRSLLDKVPDFRQNFIKASG